jgi:UDP-glucose 4-epimerase
MRGEAVMRGKKVLVTGGLGFIGSNLTRRCCELGAAVTVYDCLDPHSGGNLFNVADIRKDIDLRYHDILDFDRLSECVADKDFVFNCAASTSHPFSMREPWLDMDANVRGVINVIEAIRRFNKCVSFVHIGTSTQLGKLIKTPGDELHPEYPTDIYSASKSVSEKYVLIYANAHRLNASVVRLSNVYGPRASIHSPEFTFNNYFIGLALRNTAITVYGNGAQLRNVLYVDDAVSALVAAAGSERAFGQVFFAVGDAHYSVAQLAEATVKHIGSGTVSFVEWPAGRQSVEIGDAVLSNAKIKSTLGWSPTVGLEQGLLLTREYYHGCAQEYLR